MLDFLALVIVVLTGLYFITLAAVSLLAPARANRFLLGFADSASVHYIELLLRFVVGDAFLLHAPRTPFSSIFNMFGWVLVVTTGCLLLVPWRWHRRFAQQAVPRAARYIALIGLASLLIGSFILVATFQDRVV
ncbi:MAG: hypothetical protein ABIO30_09185 [Thermomonas sp.]